MLPDFRFAIGAILAITMLGVTGFGLAMSVQLMHEARVGSFDASRSLAFADNADRNQFYDADAARRFQGLDAKVDEPDADVPVDPAAVPSRVVALATPDDRTASLARSDAGTGQAAEPDAAPAAVRAPVPDQPAADPPPNAVEAKPDTTEYVASAPAVQPPAEQVDDGGPPAQPIAGAVPLPPDPAKPVVHARPKRRHLLLRARVVRPAPPAPTTYTDSGFSLTNGQWPSSDGGLNTTPPGKKPRTQLTGSLPGR
jgi:hypothetical protein